GCGGSGGSLRPSLEGRLLRGVGEVTAATPAAELAIQWDVCLEVGFWDRPYFNFLDDDPVDGATQAAVLGKLGALGDRVPAGVELGYHLCYGDWGHRHFKQPDDAGRLGCMASGISAATYPQVHSIHPPTPPGREDSPYFH